jgi:hypothetical protein
MSTTRISSTLRSAVVERAQRKCEYCQLPQEAAWASFEIDHIIAEKHGGETISDNLAHSCIPCNSYKGPDLTSIDPQTGEVTRLFNPRTQKWTDHFALTEDGRILPRTAEGRTTARLLRFNDPLRIQQRADLIMLDILSPTAS